MKIEHIAFNVADPVAVAGRVKGKFARGDAEAAGVRLAAHPDDPPMPTVRAQPRLVYQPHLYQKLLDLRPSASNTLEFCLGSLAEMTEGSIYDAVETYSRQGKLGYIHFRNVRDKVPYYKETFVDDGEIDMLRVLRILKQNNYQGVLIPDHAPQMNCSAPWHCGMAYALGWMKAALRCIEEERVKTVRTLLLLLLFVAFTGPTQVWSSDEVVNVPIAKVASLTPGKFRLDLRQGDHCLSNTRQ